ncbi:MAG TPA: hypothetical protein VFH63_00875 [candidate division Zixibacteria bacterium]|nr:hypothetical protein [candidate division Zixibacteria bacterium]
MRIYEGSPRQDWEEVLRAIGAFADRERLKELLLLELEEGFLLQGLSVAVGGADSDTYGALTKRTYELLDDQVAQLMEEAAANRGTAESEIPHAGLENYYQQALRIIGNWVDREHARDLFFFEQDGSFVLRVLQAGGGAVGHQLAEFTRDEIVAMIEAAPQQRNAAPEGAGAPTQEAS